MKYKTRFLLFFVAMALFHLASNFAHPVTPTIIQALGLPDYMFGLMLAVMMIANFALSPSWGNINRFISSRQSLLICCVGYALTQLGFAIPPPRWAFSSCGFLRVCSSAARSSVC